MPTDSLQEVQNTFLDDGVMKSENIPKAALLLAEYGAEFEVREEQAYQAIKTIRETVMQLN